MSAHRRSASRTGTGSRRARGRRTPYRLLPVAVGLSVLGLGALTGPAVINNGWVGGGDGSDSLQIRPAGLPSDLPAEGLVYGDLVPAGKDSLCAGAYEIDELTCTHGPDPAPGGLRVGRDVAPVTAKAAEPQEPRREAAQVPDDAEIVRDQGGSLLTEGKPAFLDAPAVIGTASAAAAACTPGMAWTSSTRRW